MPAKLQSHCITLKPKTAPQNTQGYSLLKYLLATTTLNKICCWSIVHSTILFMNRINSSKFKISILLVLSSLTMDSVSSISGGKLWWSLYVKFWGKLTLKKFKKRWLSWLMIPVFLWESCWERISELDARAYSSIFWWDFPRKSHRSNYPN